MIEKIRLGLGMDQSCFGKRYDRSQSVVSKWENPDSPLQPNADIAMKMVKDAKAAGIKNVSLEAIYGG